MLTDRTKLTRNDEHRTDDVFINLANRDEVKSLFSDFNNLSIETSERTDRGLFMSHFIVSAEK